MNANRNFTGMVAALPLWVIIGVTDHCHAAEKIEGKPTNLDEHGEMSMDEAAKISGVDRATAAHGFAPSRNTALRRAPAWKKGVVPVYTRSMDSARSGANLKETLLTPANVAGMRKLFSMHITDDARGCEAQPLLVPSVTIASGTTHDLCIVCSMANTVWAFDANDGAVLWVRHLGVPVRGNREIDGWMINDHWGILSTPVIDPDTATLYCVSWSDPNGDWKAAKHKFHSLRLSDGAPVASPVDFTGVTYDPGHQLPVQSFKSSERKQRSSLLLETIGGHKTVFVPFGTIKETTAGARGWLLAVDVAANKVTAAWTATSKYSGGGIWMAGQGPAADGRGNIYLVTGNGSFDGITDFGEAFLRLEYLPPSGGQEGLIRVVDWFSPFSDSGRAGGPQTGEHITIDKGGGWDDMDLGSGGAIYIASKNLVGGAGKDGIWYSLDAEHLGKTMPADFADPAANYAKAKWIGWFTYYNPNVSPTPRNFTDLNQIYANRSHHQHATPVVFESLNHGTMLFGGGENGNVRAWTVNGDGSLKYLACGSEVASVQSPVPPGGMPGFMLALSANGQKDAIVWATCPLGDANREVTTGLVYAYDATNLGTNADGSGALKLIWSSPHYIYNKFNTPVVSGGKLYVPTYDGYVDVYGL